MSPSTYAPPGPLAWVRDNAKRLFAVVCIATGVLFVTGTTTFAQDAGDSPVVVDGGDVITFTPVQVTIITGLIMPFVLGVVYKFIANASQRTKGIVGLVAAAAVALVERGIMVDGSGKWGAGLLLDVLLVYIPQLGTYVGIWGQPDSSGRSLNATIAGAPKQPRAA